MKRICLSIVSACLASSALADIVVTTRTLRAGDIITASDVKLIPGLMENAYDRMADVIGQEARVALYPKRGIPFEHVGPPALVDRNQIVALHYSGMRLSILTEGRALERGAIGDRVRIMNLTSRATLFGYVQADGSVAVKN